MRGLGNDYTDEVCRYDQDRALKFYTEKLGFEVSTDQVFDDRHFFNGSFACDDVSATYRQLKGRGVIFLQEPQKQPGASSPCLRIQTAISSCCPHPESSVWNVSLGAICSE